MNITNVTTISSSYFPLEALNKLTLSKIRKHSVYDLNNARKIIAATLQF